MRPKVTLSVVFTLAAPLNQSRGAHPYSGRGGGDWVSGLNVDPVLLLFRRQADFASFDFNL